MEEKELTQRVRDYWTERTPNFSIVRHNELKDEISRRWLEEMNAYLPKHGPLDILDVGTGTGYFAILLAKAGHRVTGIDMTPEMIEEAVRTAEEQGVRIRFLPGDDAHLGPVVHDAGVFPGRGQVLQDGDVRQGMVQALPDNADQEEFVISPPHRFLHRKEGIRVILLSGQHDGFHVRIRLLMGVKVPDDQGRFHLQEGTMPQSAVAEDHKIIVP